MRRFRILAISIAVAAAGGTADATVTLVEGGHTLNQIVDSAVPLDPSQTMLDTVGGTIASIGVNKATGTLYVQLAGDSTTNIFSVSPTGVVGLVKANTGFQLTDRGTDLAFDPTTGLLLTQDHSRVATVDPTNGTVGTYTIGRLGTFGMDFSNGSGGSVVPAGFIVFVGDGAGNQIQSSGGGGGAATGHLQPSVSGDDIVIQPDGDWVHIADHGGVITAYAPFPPYAASSSLLSVRDMFNGGLGTRATSCTVTGDIYVSQTAGGEGIFRVDETLATATQVLSISGGLADLTMGPSTSGSGHSVYFAVHNGTSDGEEVWEVTVPECPACGNSVIDAYEECDDGNTSSGDGCGASCKVEPCFSCTGQPSICTPVTDGTPCNDGNLCTNNDACTGGVCMGSETPAAICRGQTVSNTGKLILKDKVNDARDKLVWKWRKGVVTSKATFGDPRTASGPSYELCIYNNTGQLISRERAPAGGGCNTKRPRPCWKELASLKGFKYIDPERSPDGLKKVILKEGLIPGRAKVTVVGGRVLLDMPALDFLPPSLPLTVQLRNSAGECWGASYGWQGGRVILNREDKFIATGD